jgi:hypothetical protein
VDYRRDIKPILQSHCTGCHNVSNAKGGLALDSRSGISKGGRSGKLFLAGKGSKSLLVKRLKGQGGARMPKGGPPLSASQVQLVSKWIDQGPKL